MIKQKAIYNKDFNLIDYKEFYYDILVKHEIYNEKGYLTYWENSDGYWSKYEYDDNNNETYWENSDGKWKKRKYVNNKLTYSKDYTGYWIKYEYDNKGNRACSEDSDGFWFNRDSDGQLLNSGHTPRNWHTFKLEE